MHVASIAKKRISILGSCVTRDIFYIAPINNVRIVRYVARSSLISMFSPKLIEPTKEMLESSKWRDRMQVLDLNKNGIKVLFSRHFDYLLIDLIDERLGIITDGTAVATIAPFVNNSEFMNNYRGILTTLLPFDDGYFERWQRSLQTFISFIKQKSITKKIILNKSFLTQNSSDGSIVAEISSEFVEKMNRVLRQMYDAFETALPNLRVIEYGESDLFVNRRHRWGAGPFHYDFATYKHASKVILQIISSDIQNSKYSNSFSALTVDSFLRIRKYGAWKRFIFRKFELLCNEWVSYACRWRVVTGLLEKARVRYKRPPAKGCCAVVYRCRNSAAWRRARSASAWTERSLRKALNIFPDVSR